jgi:RNA polymerase sigma-70 factor (ECF subfamily)
MLEQAAIPISDQHLLAQTARGDQAAFEELYERFELPVYNYLLRLVCEQAVAEDLLQEVFMAVWNGAGGFRGQAQVRTWIFHIAHNQAVSWLRSHRSNVAYDDSTGLYAQDDPEREAMENWRNDHLRRAVSRLNPSLRAVVELAFFNELSYTEIAAVVSCPVGTVKSRMSSARRCLGEMMKEAAADGHREASG